MNKLLLKLKNDVGLTKGLLSMAMCFTISLGAQAQDTGEGGASEGGSAPATAPATGPHIGGNVFGGGRMAAVTNTAGVHTNSTDDAATNTCTIDIYKGTIDGNVFGGNDITGDVRQPRYDADGNYDANATNEREGDNSAVVNIHNTCGETIKIDEVYGGGNGYYTYCFNYRALGVTSGDYNTSYTINANALATNPNLRWLFTQKAPAGGLEVKVYPADATEYTDANMVASYTVRENTSLTNVIPIAHNARVTVGDDVLADNTQDKILVDEVYGGAKMAWMSGEGGVTINSGTIGKAFAGNNYGGVVQTTSLTINGTKRPETAATKDNFATFDWSKVGLQDGTGFGIGEAYGGGNAVDVNTRALVYMEDGYVGTLFGGNNLADMSAVPTVHLNGGNLQTVYGGGNAGAMKGCIPGAIDVSQYLDNTLFEAYNNTVSLSSGQFTDYCSNEAYLYFYGAETLVDQKDDNVPLRIGTVYGGCRAADVLLSTYVRMTKADYMGNIYAGCDISGSVAKGGAATGTTWVETAKTYVTTSQMTIEIYDPAAEDPAHGFLKTLPAGFPIINSASMVTMTGGTTSGNMFAGGNGDYTYTEDGDKVKVYPVGAEQTAENLLATINKSDYYRPWVAHAVAAMEGGELLGNLYGGGNNATIGLPAIGETPAVEGRSYVFLGKTARGNQNPTAGPQSAIYAGGKKSDVYGTVDVIVKAGCDLNALYAGNDISGQVKGTNRKNFLTAESPLYTPLFGGGTTYSDQSLLAPYGDASNMVQTYVRVEGADATNSIPAAKIKTLFGGGNGDYDYTTEGSPYYGLTKPTQHSCWLDIKGDVETSYGGGNAAEVNYSNTYITGDATVGTAFAGGNSATVTTAANLWLDCDATRGTQAFVDGSNNTNIPNVGTIFGGNNLADMYIVPKVQLHRGSVQTVYGGGNQGSMKGVRPYMVDLKEYVSGNWFNDHYPLYSSDKVLCFKGTNLVIDSKYEQKANHTPTENPCGLVIGDVYAGCRAANVDNSSYVRVSHCDYIRNVYGGCDIAGSVGMYPGYFASSSPYRETADGENNGKVKFYHLNSDYVVEEVYKEVPENAPMVNPTSCVLLTGGTVSGNIYGSGNGAYNYVEDGNTVKVYNFGDDQDEAHLQASYDKTKMTKPFSTVTTVQIAGGTVKGNVYGGGNLAEVGRIVTADDVANHTAVGYEPSTKEGKAAYKLFPSWTTTLINGSTTFPEHYVKVGDEISAISNVFLGKSETGRSDVVINGNVYGGGRMADVHGAMDIIALHDVTINSLFAGNDIAGSVLGTSRVSRFTPNTDYTTLIGDENDRAAILNTSFSGVNLTANNANTYVRIMPDAKITNLYGGGNGYYFYEQNSDKVKIYSLNEDKSKGSTYYGEVTAASVEDAKPVQQSTFLDVAGNVTTSYGGGNAANIGTSNLWIVKDAQVGTAFAGGNAATVTKAANLYLDCDGTRSTMDHLNKANGKIPNVGTIFGGNNIADMNIVPWMELHRGSVKTVYGGGNKGNMCGHDALFVDGTKFINPAVFNHKYPTYAPDSVLLFAATDVMIDSKYKTNADGTDNPNDGLIVGDVYGGCKQANVNNSSYMRITHAQHIGNVYGGCDISGSVGFNPGTLTPDMVKDGKMMVYFTNGQPATEGVTISNDLLNTPLYNASTFVYMTGGTVSGNVYGGGNGDYDYTQGDYTGLAAPFVAATTVNLVKGTIQGNLYGGGNKADVGYVYQEAGSYMGKSYNTGDMLTNMSYIYMGNGAESTSVNVEGAVYGGCKNANVYGAVDILALKDVNINKLFAGNDISGAVQGNWRGTRFSREASNITSLIGVGTDQESRLAATKSFSGQTLTGENANVYVRVMPGAQITNIFGGGNGDYDYTSGTYSGLTSPAMHSTVVDVAGNVSTVYGGGNAADIDMTHVCIYGQAVIGTDETAGAVYGGCKSANVTHAANVLMVNGGANKPKVHGNVFGGCDISGNVGGTTHTGRLDISNIDDNIGYAKVQILGGTVTGRVFGGGNGLQSADGIAYYTADASAANNGLTMVGTAPDESYQYPNGTYQGKTLPQVENSWVTLEGCTIGTTPGSGTHTLFGGGQGAGTRVIHNVDLLVGDGTDGSTVETIIKGISYGGSYAGFVNTDCEDHTRTVLLGYGANTQVQGDIYGGSYGNYVRGEISLNINNISIGVDENAAGIYAGNNNAGQPECNASINFVGNDCNVALYGGGNMAPFYGTTRITFTKGSVGYIYGGGNHAPVYGNTIVEVLGGHVCHDVFGGGNEGAVLVNTEDAAHPYGGNTLVIVRDDCLKLGSDAEGRAPGDDGYVPTFEEDPITGNYAANRSDSEVYYGTSDPYTEAKNLYVLAPNSETAPFRSKIEIEGNVYGGGNAADVEGSTTVIIGDQAEN